MFLKAEKKKNIFKAMRSPITMIVSLMVHVSCEKKHKKRPQKKKKEKKKKDN